MDPRAARNNSRSGRGAGDAAEARPRPWTPGPAAPTMGPFRPWTRGRTAMRLGLINSAWVQAGQGTAFGIRMTKEIGFDSIDIFADPLDLDAKERRLIRRECE